jgi:signal peptidase I
LTTKSTPAQESTAPETTPKKVEETPFEALASICSVLVIGLYILTFLGQNYVIPSGSMENTLLVGDHLLVDQITLAPPSKWMPLVHYREPRRGDVIVFIKPVPDPDAQGNLDYLKLVKRLIGLPGDHIHLHDGVVYVNGKPQPLPKTALDTPASPLDQVFLDEFPAVPPVSEPGNLIPESWELDFPNHVVNGDLVVPPGEYFMMGDHRHDSADSRFWGFVPRANIVGRPLFNYWSFKADESDYNTPGLINKVEWLGHVAIHFFTDTRWNRTLKVIH